MAESHDDQAAQRDIAQRTERLRQAINWAGGATAVSRKAAMATTTINNYLAGRDMKASALVTLAKVCGVRVEWLATGHGDIQQESSDQVSVTSFPADQLLSPAHFKALVMLLISCREFYEKTGSVPTLADALDWIAPLYGKFLSMPDDQITLKTKGQE